MLFTRSPQSFYVQPNLTALPGALIADACEPLRKPNNKHSRQQVELTQSPLKRGFEELEEFEKLEKQVRYLKSQILKSKHKRFELLKPAAH